MRIDAHQHFWQYDPSDYPWISDELSVLKRDFLPGDLEPHLSAHGLDGCVAVQASHTVKETDFLLELAKSHDSVKGVVGWVDLRDPQVEGHLERLAEHPNLKGIRHIVQDEPDIEFLLKPEFLRGVSVLSKYDLTYDILIFPKHLDATLEFVRKFPGHRLVIDHLAKPHIKKGELEPWAASMRRVAEFDHVHCKLSGMVTEADWQAWQPGDFRPYMEVVLEAFGADQVMYGSDWPVCLLAADYAQVFDIAHDFVATLSEEEQRKIMGQNAVGFYGLA